MWFQVRRDDVARTGFRIMRRSRGAPSKIIPAAKILHLLARPDNPVHPGDLGQVEAVVLVRRIEAAQFDAAS